MSDKKYPKGPSLRKYFELPGDILDRIHNGIKHNGNGDIHKTYQPWMKRIYPADKDKE